MGHIKMFFPNFHRGVVQWGTQAMISSLADTPPFQLARGEGHIGKGRSIGLVQAGGDTNRFYDSPSTLEEVASDVVITGIVYVCHEDASVLFDLGSTYSYMSSYFASYLRKTCDSLDNLIYMCIPI